MNLRYTRAAQLNLQAPHKCHLPNGHEYLFTTENGGVVDVPYKQDIERMLNPLNGLPSLYQIAYDRYGISFDDRGKEVVAEAMPVEDTPALVEPLEPPVRRGRPKKA